MDLAIVAAAGSIAVASITIIGFWTKFSDRITKANASAESALLVAAEAEQAAKEANERTTHLTANFSLYREQSIEKFVTHTMISALEMRLVESQAKTEQRLVDTLDGLNKRLDRLIEAGLGGRTPRSP